tara:strand:+ start:743 stop:1882 length:1140 start_codon:yes stop_codon:yes gene_type:complete
MKNNLTFVALCFTVILNAQWMDNTSCSKKASLIANNAIEYVMNLEHMAAFGAANSALLIDEDCGCAKLILAAVSSSNANWGSRSEKLKAINTTKLSPEEKGWHQFLTASSENREAVSKSLASKFPKGALMNYLATSPQDFNTFKAFAKKFPKYASSAYNMMSYGYMRGDYGKEDATTAMKYVKMSQEMHDGPNSHDSMAEHYATNGEYEKALNAALKAVDYATFSSPYMKTAQLYYAKKNKKSISDKVIAHQESMQKAIMSGDYEAYKKFEHPEINVPTGDSNLNPFYIYTEKDVVIDTAITWEFFKLSNMETYFSPDMNTAVITFVADGKYTFIDDAKTVSYATRGSSVWNYTNDGWKILHTSYAPRKGRTGIPERTN